MAFLKERNERAERFSLLLLDPGEIYFEDFGVFYYSPGLSEEESIKQRQRGRLKICSRSILFDPKDIKYPIIKFHLRDVSVIKEWIGPLLSRIDAKNKMFMIESKQEARMKEHNIIAPYTFKREKQTHLFSLIYITTEDCLPKLCQLHRASTLPPGDQVAMINAIVISRQSRVKFDTSWLEDLYESIVLETRGDHITPLMTNPGRIMLTSSRLYFQPFNNVNPLPVVKIRLSEIKRLIRRRFLLRHVGLEIFCPSNKHCCHLYLVLPNMATRDDLYKQMLKQDSLKLDKDKQADMTLRWQNGLLSNFDYIMYINSLADRSINDLTQYPVFPWVVADYTSTSLDLTNPDTFRDLSKPIGALNDTRLSRLRERMKDMPEPKFLYGSHYSTPGYILHYLARIAPEYVLCLQNGRFDMPDRMFNRLDDTWRNCLSDSSDFKELIPEFYDSEGEFLTNCLNINFGVRQSGEPVLDVKLPPWAEDAVDFIKQMRDALESDFVSQHVHHWIDLVFGYKQRGEEADKANNLFYYLTYEGAVDIDSIEDLNQRKAMENQIMEFGQTPKQIFSHPHPARFSTSLPIEELSLSPSPEKPIEQTEEESRASPPRTNSSESLTTMSQSLRHNLHKGPVTDIRWSHNGKQLFSVSQDTMLKVYSVEDQLQQRSASLSNMPLSSCEVMPDDTTVLVGSWDNNVYIYSIEYGRVLNTIYAHDDAVTCVRWNKDLLVSSSWDSSVKCWDVKAQNSGQWHSDVEQLSQLDHEVGVNCVSVHPDNLYIASGTQEGHIYVWDTQTQTVLSHVQAHSGVVTAIAFSSDGQRLVTCGDDEYIRVVDVNTGTETFSKKSGHHIRCAKWAGNTVLTGTNSGDILVWDLNSVKLTAQLPAQQGSVNCMAISNTGSVASGGEDGVVTFWKPTYS